ncbi:hypothetical protein [Pleionea sp. CnH1-48]|uniref:hypothetical protein n=1 Tax=Pleionea sp. CnH1-48 TaxID=2954494 RepID=UPI0020968E19|nr:hypothetical protein [Pleionea sp. CnH1-48]MCO7225112.1 hypothetical protein [Pleionea sp. CnH1-48]
MNKLVIFFVALLSLSTTSLIQAASAKCYVSSNGKEFCVICNDDMSKCKVVIFDNNDDRSV